MYHQRAVLEKVSNDTTISENVVLDSKPLFALSHAASSQRGGICLRGGRATVNSGY